MNKIIFAGKVVSEPQFSHEIFNRKYYEFTISSVRRNGIEDTVLCTIPEESASKIKKDSYIEVSGRLSSRQVYVPEGRTVHSLFLAVSEINEYVTDMNTCEIWGVIQDAPVHKMCKGDKQLAKFAVVSKRQNQNRCDYIRCLAWNDNALEAIEYEVGYPVHVVGRLQSRYDTNCECTKYEVSIPRNGVLEIWEP